MEAAAGKNPVTHVDDGELYNIVTQVVFDCLVMQFFETPISLC